MRDKRAVGELSVEELERILAIRKREARLGKLRHDGEQHSVTVAPAIHPDDDAGSPRFEDEWDAPLTPGRQPGRLRKSRSGWNRALTAVEIAAAIGVLALLIGLFQAFRQITQTTANGQAEYDATRRASYVPPTATPIINVAAVVLPDGHTFKDGEAVFNMEEIPVQYRDQYAALMAQLPAVRPTSSPEEPIRIRIPRLTIDSAVVAGDDWEALKLGVGHMRGSADPGQRGNMVLSAHNDVYGELFRHLDQLQPGDEITVSTRSKDYTYLVEPYTAGGETRGYRIVNPSDTWALDSRGDSKMLTLVSCYPYRVDTKRIIVFATLLQ